MFEEARRVYGRGEDRFEEVVIWLVEGAFLHGRGARPLPIHRCIPWYGRVLAARPRRAAERCAVDLLPRFVEKTGEDGIFWEGFSGLPLADSGKDLHHCAVAEPWEEEIIERSELGFMERVSAVDHDVSV